MTSRTLEELAALCGAEVEGDGSLVVTGPAGLDDAEPGTISFLAQPKYAARLGTTRASAVVVARSLVFDRGDLALLRCEDPERAFTEVVLAFAPPATPLPEGAAPSAVVDGTATVAAGARIGPHVSIGPGARVESGATLHAGVRVGAGSRIGADTVVHANVVMYPNTIVGERCILHSGTVLGADGLGFRPENGGWTKIPQVGNVVIEDDVEIGANVTIDCARFGSTRVGAGTKIDNLVQLGHNVQIGKHCMILAQVGIAGSTIVEDGAILAGQVGVAGHLRIGARARLAAKSGVSKDVPAGEDWFGIPAGPSRQFLRRKAQVDRLPEEVASLRAEIASLSARLEERESSEAPGGSSSSSG